MVGHRFVEALRARDTEGRWRITVFAEEADAAYDRVGLTSYTESWDRALLALPGNDYQGDPQVRLVLNQRVTEIDRATKSVVTADGQRHHYDTLVLATGSYAFVPPVPGHELPACLPRLPHPRRPRRHPRRRPACGADRPCSRRRGHRRRPARAGGR